jgi:hypothetical protein
MSNSKASANSRRNTLGKRNWTVGAAGHSLDAGKAKTGRTATCLRLIPKPFHSGKVNVTFEVNKPCNVNKLANGTSLAQSTKLSQACFIHHVAIETHREYLNLLDDSLETCFLSKTVLTIGHLWPLLATSHYNNDIQSASSCLPTYR